MHLILPHETVVKIDHLWPGSNRSSVPTLNDQLFLTVCTSVPNNVSDMIPNMSSSARLSSQLKGIAGSADLVIIGVHLDGQWARSFEKVRCIAIIDKEQTNISRQTSLCTSGTLPQWNETFTLRCFSHWGLEFILTGTDQQGDTIQMHSDLISFQHPGICNVPVRYGVKCVGELQVSVVFHPNYRSFKYLALGCTLSEQLSYSLINTILTELNTQDKMHAIASEDDIIRIIAAVDNFTTFLTQEEAYSGELCLALKLKTSYNGKLHNPPDSDDPHHYKTLLTKEAPVLPKSIPLHKVAIGAKNFLSKLLDDLPQPPPVTINLIEKQLTIFTQSLYLPTTELTSRETLNLSSSSASSASDAANEIHLTWAHFAQFCVVSALWFLQQAVAANALLAQCSNLTLPELDALRFGFSQYDTELSGVISSADLYSLLQDMGEEYSETEIGLTACYLDPDNLGFLEFSEFVHWWCE